MVTKSKIQCKHYQLDANVWLYNLLVVFQKTAIHSVILYSIVWFNNSALLNNRYVILIGCPSEEVILLFFGGSILLGNLILLFPDLSLVEKIWIL